MKNNKGFSLVELIVVIAIMAILAAVAVIGVSVYIPKAQQASDEQLISDIEYAMTLAGYTGDFVVGDKGYIILRADDAPRFDGDDKIVEVMEATFGSNWQKEVALQYDGWIVNTELLELAVEEGAAIPGSIYLQSSSPAELLENVQTVTNAAASMLGELTKDNPDEYIASLKGNLGDGYMEKAAAAGLLEYDENTQKYSFPEGSYDTETNKLGSDLQTQLANLMVLSVAEELAGLNSDQMSEIITGTDSNVSTAAQLAVIYSVAKAADLKHGGNTPAFENLNTGFKNAAGMNDLWNSVGTYVDEGGSEQWNGYFYVGEGDSKTVSTEAKTNLGAVSAIMNGVSSVSGEYANADSLNDAGLFTSGGISNYLNMYVSAAALQIPTDVENGIVLIYEMGDDGIMHVYSLYS